MARRRVYPERKSRFLASPGRTDTRPGMTALRKVTLFQHRMPALLMLSAALVMAGCGGKAAPESQPLVTVQAVQVERAQIEQQVSSEAVLYPLHQATIVPKISAPIQRFFVERGDRVHAGQLLAVLENKDLAGTAAQARGAYEQAQANYESATAASLPEQITQAKGNVASARASFAAAQKLYDNSKKLYQQGALAGKQVDQAQVGLAQAQAQLQSAEQQLEKLQSVGMKAQLKSAKGQLDSAKGAYDSAAAQLSYSEIRSPIDGVVTDRPLFPGDMASTTAPLLTVMSLSQVVARARVPASEAALLKVGDVAEISGPGASERVAGKVTVVSPAVDPNSTTVQVWVEARNPGGDLMPGSTVTVTVTAKKVPDALVIPRAALLSDPDLGPYVMAIDSASVARQTKVKTGIEQDGKVQIIQGLQQGQLIVGQGGYGLPDGTKVKY
ncbi:MAG TPA: efflux RND transporter periplasmic adaptor subunit [Terriglobia bacterium]|nr:efflux RND transporter periplasmic adaptor subunit [Terriglobia bacterium]